MSTAATARRALRALTLTGITLVAAACSSVDAPSFAGLPSSTSTPNATPSEAGTPPTAPVTSPSLARPTTRHIVGHVVGAEDSDSTYPAYSVEVPAGWSSSGAFVIPNAAAVMGLSVWDAVKVPADPCRWEATMTTPGPTVDDLVQALVAQKTRNATTPTALTLAGHDGVSFEWSVPNDTGFSDACDKWPDNGYRDFVSFLGVGGSERYQQVAGQVDRLWVLDVDGQRLVVDATYSPDATKFARDELGQVAESLRFQSH